MARSKVTPEQILREAARLFATKGFHGTSTREIAEAVGVRQPSLFHHFASKHDIARALYAYDYERSPGLRGEREVPDGTPASVELYQGVRREILVEMTSAYDLRGLYLSALIDEPEFAEWQAIYHAALGTIRGLIERGVMEGDFVPTRADVVVEVLDATINQAVRWSGAQPDTSLPDDVATLALRLVLARPSRIPAIRRQADRILESQGIRWADELASLGDRRRSR
ncbi:TetR/AcrR family transcriptional regulator [Pimelobacter simplex]|uniref:TetR/AcrR family transcriptional regulator n=1 Tax=Nocardioides simplex TaxID=2045 RepID=UPI00193173A8|nr:TetR/AcrR family transcriptional regulator [Pimelobacter simplex]